MHIVRRSLFLLTLLVYFVIFSYTSVNAESKYQILQHPFYDPNSCGGDEEPPAGTGDKVYMIGDSIADAARKEINTELLADFSSVVINAKASRALSSGSSELDGISVLDDDKDKYKTASVIIVELGTNGGITTSDINKVINVIQKNNNGAEVYWVNIGVDNSKRNGPSLDAKSSNDALDRKAGKDFKVIDWENEVKDHPNYIDPNPSTGLGVHPSSVGKDALAKTIEGAISGTNAQEEELSSQCCSDSSGGDSSTKLSGKDNEEKTWNYFKGKGLSDKQVAGIMGNILQESHFDPQIVQGGGRSEDPSDAGSGGWGLIQWTPGSKVVGMLKASGVKGKIYELSTQLDLIWQHMHNHPIVTKPFSLKHFKTIDNEVEAGQYFGSQIEGFGEAGARFAFTTQMLKKYGGKSADGSSGSSSSSSEGCSSDNSASPDCASAKGNEKILCEAKKYDKVDYLMGGGHAGGAAYHKACPTVKGNSDQCALDCSGIVTVAVYDAFKNSGSWTTFTLVSDSKNWKKIDFKDIKPGDLVEPEDSHVEIVDHVKGNTIYTFGAHSANRPQPKQVGPAQWQHQAGYIYLRYVGKGAAS